MPKSVSTRSAYKMLTCIYLCRTLLFFAPYADFFNKINSQLTPELIKTQLGTDITQDPEITVYHPAKLLNDIYQLVGMKYDKHKGDAHAITSSLSKSDYIRLKDSGKCESFKEFINDIV